MYIIPTEKSDMGYVTYIFDSIEDPKEVFHLVPWYQESWGTLNYFIAFALAKKLNYKIVSWGDKNLLPFLSLISHEARVYDYEEMKSLRSRHIGIFEHKSVVNHFLPQKYVRKKKDNINFLCNEHILMEIVSRIDEEFKEKYLKEKSTILPRTHFPDHAIEVLHKHNMYPENFYNIDNIKFDIDARSVFEECEHRIPYNSVWCEIKSRWYGAIEDLILKYPPKGLIFETLAKDPYRKSFQTPLYSMYPDYYMSIQIMASMFKNVKFMCIGGSSNIFSVIPAQTYFTLSREWYSNDSYEYKRIFESEFYGNDSKHLHAPIAKLLSGMTDCEYLNKTEVIMKEKSEEDYKKVCEKQTDINEHLPVLRKYAEKCEHITELGVRKGLSTRAFLLAKPKKLISVDLHLNKNVKKLGEIYDIVDWDYIQGDSTTIELDETDLLFIDTYHIYEQLKKELTLHGNKSRKYLIFHDTETFGDVDEKQNGEGKGLNAAINEFMEANPHWIIDKIFKNNNGLTILKRIN